MSLMSDVFIITGIMFFVSNSVYVVFAVWKDTKLLEILSGSIE